MHSTTLPWAISHFQPLQIPMDFLSSYGMYDHIKNEIIGHEFYNVGDYDITSCPTICMDATMLIALKHLKYGCATSLCIDYFQMGELTDYLCVETLCKCVDENLNLRE